MKKRLIYLMLLLMTIALEETFAQVNYNDPFNWSKLQPIPDQIGFAGSFAGVANDALIVAGGANFPDGGAPWTGSLKAWTNRVFVLEKPNGSWKEIGKLPYRLGYGASINYKNSMILLGGSNENGHHQTALKLDYQQGEIRITELPKLPKPIANTCAVIVGNVIYVMGGISKPDAKTAEGNFWALDLAAKELKWKILPTWPGPARMLSVAGTSNGEVYIFSGVELIDGQRNYLKDAYRYHPKKGWTKIADLPYAVAAAPSLAFQNKQNELLIFGGDDGVDAPRAAALKDKHPGFSAKILSYHPLHNKWTVAGSVITDKKADAVANPNGSIWAPVTTTLTIWNGKIILPGGEVRPATRTPNVLMASPTQK